MLELLAQIPAGNPVLVHKGEIITIRQALTKGVVRAFIDPGTDNVAMIELNPHRSVSGGMRVLLSLWNP